ncbi:BTAD domain-containing putative transcriptional regulator [Kitasatospora aureofaciens]|uniref:BTAD domain-containing putative transcriptional regulator n=1 Tax=Kitasatospora aureofaciens TaxID=1894 RepID=UPI0036F49B0E
MEPGFRLLGATGVRLGGQPVRPGPPQQQAVLAVLLLRGGRTVTARELVVGVWGHDAPARALRSVRTYAWALRALLEPDRAPREPSTLLLSDGDGYTLRVPDDALDVTVFERLLRAAREARARGDLASAHRSLDEALALWGGEPFTGVPGPHAECQRTRLVRLRLEAQAQYFDCALALGLHDRVLPELSALAREHPLDEHLQGLLMRALDSCGRQAEALKVYGDTRRLLAAELGVPPGRELVDIRDGLATGGRRIRTGPPATPRSPAAGGELAGREGAVVELERTLTDLRRHEVPVAVITGAGGTGKTTLATQVAHRVAADFPDGRLSVDLRGSSPAQLPEGVVLARLLRSLGVPPEEVPAETEQRAALYRSMLAGRRILVVLDDAADAAQVAPLLPGSPGCAAVVTARSRAFVLPGATQLALPVRPWPATDRRRQLPPRLARALESLAGSGAPTLPIELVGRLLGTDREEAERIAESLVDAGVLDSPAYGTYQVARPGAPSPDGR